MIGISHRCPRKGSARSSCATAGGGGGPARREVRTVKVVAERPGSASQIEEAIRASTAGEGRAASHRPLGWDSATRTLPPSSTERRLRWGRGELPCWLKLVSLRKNISRGTARFAQLLQRGGGRAGQKAESGQAVPSSCGGEDWGEGRPGAWASSRVDNRLVGTGRWARGVGMPALDRATACWWRRRSGRPTCLARSAMSARVPAQGAVPGAKGVPPPADLAAGPAGRGEPGVSTLLLGARRPRRDGARRERSAHPGG